MRTHLYAVVSTDNYGRDYPMETFVGDTESGVSIEQAERIAAEYNAPRSAYAPRFYKVVPLPYTLDRETP